MSPAHARPIALRWFNAGLGLAIAWVMLLHSGYVGSATHAAPQDKRHQAAQDRPQDEPVADRRLHRELYVPIEHLDALLSSGDQRVYLEREEFDRLLMRRQVESKSPPIDSAVLAANYSMRISGDRAFIDGELTIANWQTQPTLVPLELSNVGLLSANVDGGPARLTRDQHGRTLLMIEGEGTHRCHLHLVTSVQVDAARQTLQFQLPRPPACQLEVVVPGDVEVTQGADVVERVVDTRSNTTRFQWILRTGPMSVTMSLNNKRLQDSSITLARSVLVSELRRGGERLHATTSLHIVHGAVNEFRAGLDENVEVHQVDADRPHQWQVVRGESGPVLVVRFPTPVTDLVVLRCVLDVHRGADSQWQFPRFAPMDTIGASAVAGVLLEQGLRLSGIDGELVMPIDGRILVDALPQTLQSAQTVGADPLVPVAAFVVPASSQYTIAAHLDAPPAELHVASTAMFTVSEQQIQQTAVMAITPLHQRVYHVDLQFPVGWDIETVRDAQGEPLQFDTRNEDDRVRAHVTLARAVQSGETSTIHLTARIVPDDWIGDWQSQTVEIRPVEVVGATDHIGAIEILPAGDLEARVVQSEELIVLSSAEKQEAGLSTDDAGAAFQFWEPSWSATLEVQKFAPRKVARTVNFVDLQPDSMRVHAELIFLIERAATSELVFSLPESTPTEISITALAGAQVKENRSEIVDGRRRWTVALLERARGQVSLGIDFTIPRPTVAARGLELPLVRAESVDYQTGVVALESDPELEVSIRLAPDPVDVGELAEARYTVGRRVLGVFGYLGTEDQVVVDVARLDIAQLPSTIIQRAEMQVAVTPTGDWLAAVDFHLLTKNDALECRLPPAAELWSVLVDGRPALPQNVGERLLINIPAQADGDLNHRLEIVYAANAPRLTWRCRMRFPMAQLFIRGADDQPALPIVQSIVHLFATTGYRVAGADGWWSDQWIDAGPSQTGFPQRLFEAMQGRSPSVMPSLGRRYATFGEVGSLAIQSTDEAPLPATAAESEAEEAVVDELAAAANEIPAEAAMEGMPADDSAGRTPGQSAAKEAFDFSNVQAEQAVALDAEIAPDRAQPPSVAATNRAASQPAAAESSALTGLEGVRSLAVDWQPDALEHVATWQSLGETTAPEFVLVQSGHLAWLAAALALLSVAGGLLLIRSAGRWSFVVALAVAAWLLPVVTPWPVELHLFRDYGIAAAIVLGFLYLLDGLGIGLSRWLGGACRFVGRQAGSLAARRAPRKLCWYLVVGTTVAAMSTLATPLRAQQSNESSTESLDPAAIKQMLQQMEQLLGGGPIHAPQHAVVIPYDSRTGITGQEKVLVPFSWYAELIESGRGQTGNQPPPSDFLWSEGRYTLVVSPSADTLVMRGTLRFFQYSPGVVRVPLPLSGAVLASASLNGHPARLQSPIDDGTAEGSAGRKQQRTPRPAPAVELLSTGVGEKVLDVELHWSVGRQGGWRLVDGTLPAGPVTRLELTVPQGLEARCQTSVDDVQMGQGQELASADNVQVAIGSDGRLQLRWRQPVDEASIENGLTATSMAVFDVREDAARVVWRSDLQFRGEQRDALDFLLPADYVVERVVGDNIRGWRLGPAHDPHQRRLSIELLQAVGDGERVTVVASRADNLLDGRPRTIALPSCQPVGAMLHRGTVVVRASQRVQLRLRELHAAAQIDAPDLQWASALLEPSLIPVETVAAVSFSAQDFAALFLAEVPTAAFSATAQAVMKIAQAETTLECRVLIDAGPEPLFRLRLRIPAQWQVGAPILAASHQWTLRPLEAEPDRQELDIYIADGWTGQHDVVLFGRLGQRRPQGQDPPAMNLPRIEVTGASDQRSVLVVQADPAYAVQVRPQTDCRIVPLGAAADWLSPQQRQAARVALECDGTDYSAEVLVEARTPVVRSVVVANVRVTSRAVEETVLVSSTIQRAGITQMVFQLPRRFAAARIQAPLVRTTRREFPQGESGPVRIILDLQDAVMGEWAVLVQHDRLRESGEQEAPIPTIEVGETELRIIALENASTAELEVGQAEGVEELDRSELLRLRRVGRLANNRSTAVFRVIESADATTAPRLTYALTRRDVVQTVRASIGLAHTQFVVDALGGYRAETEFRVENQTEPFLEIELPPDSQLWAITVNGEGIKPAVGTGTTPRIRVPLIKTAAGELDYPVVLKYGGRLPPPSVWSTRWDIPLPKTLNISVQQTHLRLYLPEAWNWYRFTGTMGQVAAADELEAEWFSYRLRQLQELSEIVKGKDNAYAKARALANIERLRSTISPRFQTGQSFGDRLSGDLASSAGGYGKGLGIGKEVLDAATALLEGATAAKSLELSDDSAAADNREAIGAWYYEQRNLRAHNAVDRLGNNFPIAPQQIEPDKAESADRSPDAQNNLSREWLERNALQSSAVQATELSDKVQLGERLEAASTYAVPQLGKIPQIALPESAGQRGRQRGQEIDAELREQMLGGRRAQIEQYHRQLSEQQQSGVAGAAENAPRSSVQLQQSDAFGMASGGMASGGMASGGMASGGMGGGMGGMMGGGGFGPASGTVERGLRDFDAQSQIAAGAALQTMQRADGLQSAPAADRSLGFPGGAGPAAASNETAGGARIAGAGYLASHNFELPRGGQEFMFRTAGGDAVLAVHGLPSFWTRRLGSVLVALMGLVLYFVLYRTIRMVVRRPAVRIASGTALVVIGLLSSILGAPLWFVLAGTLGGGNLLVYRPKA